MGIKLTFTFSQNKKFGWSETRLLCNLNDLNAAIQPALAVARERIPLLGTGATLDYIRISNPAVRRQSRRISFVALQNGSMSLSNTNTNNTPAMNSRVALQILCSDSNTKSCIEYMSGFPDAINPEDSVVDVNGRPGWYNDFKTFVAACKENAIGMSARLPLAGAPTTFPIASIANEQVAPGRIILGVTGIGAVPVGSSIFIRGVNRLAGYFRPLNGKWKVLAFTAATGNTPSLLTLGGTEGYLALNYWVGGTVEQVGYADTPFSTMNILGVLTRKRGVGSYAPRGRSRVKKKYAS